MAEADPIAQERREACRRAVRRWLAARPAIAAHPADIRRALNAGRANDFTGEDVDAALAFLAGAGQVVRIPDELGAAIYYRITTAGTLAFERDPLG